MDAIPASPPPLPSNPSNPPPPSPAIVPPGGTKEGPIPHPSKRLWVLAGLIILILGILVGSFGTQFLNQSKIIFAPSPAPSQKDASRFSQLAASQTPTLATGADIFADWKSYTNTAYRYSIKYPNDWKASSFGPGAGTLPLDSTQREFLLAPAPLPPAKGMGIPLEDISIHIEADSAQTSGMTYEAWVNEKKKTVASTTISVSDTNLASTKAILIQKEFSVLYLLPSPDKILFYSIEAKSPTPDYRETLDQILSTFTFIN